MAIRVVVVGMGPRGQDWLREIQTSSEYELVACVDLVSMPTVTRLPHRCRGKRFHAEGVTYSSQGKAKPLDQVRQKVLALKGRQNVSITGGLITMRVSRQMKTESDRRRINELLPR